MSSSDVSDTLDDALSFTGLEMASFSDGVYISCRPRSHPAQSDFFKPVVAQVQFSDNLFEVIVFLLEIHHFITAGLTNGIPG